MPVPSSRFLAPLLLVLSLGACATPSATLSSPPPSADAKTGGDADQRLLTFLDAAYEERLALSPEGLTYQGSKQSYDRLDDHTEAGARKQQELAEQQLARMKREFDERALSPASRLSYRLFEDLVVRGRERLRWYSHGFPVTNSSNPTSNIPVFLINAHRVGSVSDARAYVSRLREVPRVMKEISERMRAQAARGIVPPRFVFAPVEADARRVLSGAPFDTGADSAVWADFQKKVGALEAPADEKARLLDEAREALKGPFKSGYEMLLATLAEVERQAKGNDGAWSLPDGAAYYADQLRFFTTTEMTPEEIHAAGLAEVERIHREMEVIQKQVGFQGSLQDFFAHVKADARSHHPNTEEGKQAYLADARRFIAQAMKEAPRLFHRLPRAALEVRAVESWRQETAPVAFYNLPAPDGSRPGIYYVNLADMNQVLKPQIEGITYHEGAPGHHFQIAFAQELEGLPKFRRFGYHGAYTEGWGLYAEKLGQELGFYADPYSRFGQLSLELWRAVRLVTDSGMHAKRWSREQAIEYFKKNTLLSDRDIVKEVERYLVWPGQATSYKVGELRLLALRARAQEALGPGFDVRDFHQVVLGNGSLPLDVLGEQVEAYIAAKRAPAAR
ncbi:lipoprotein [Cystobacter fuscus]|uniref:Lipoprotein n=1 Tax=Cystobacter fuscus TaxID=43 RepID=A0A250J500_9BACT|nr:lipoprotein [Cystobacter fuscus]